ncbi:hypothetical protein Hanom_Chr15g01400331 [Helianthus anomalus]
MGGFKISANLARFAKENMGVHGDFTRKPVAVTGKPRAQAIPTQGPGTHQETVSVKNVVIPDDTLAFKEVLGRALVGRCKDLLTLRNLKNCMGERRIQGVSLSYLGGLSLLIKFGDEEGCNKLLLNHELWEPWFSSLDVWNGRFGKVIHGSQLEIDDENFTVNWVGILVGEGDRIQEYLTLCWKYKSFRVWIEEETGDWSQESVGRVVFPSDEAPSPVP